MTDQSSIYILKGFDAEQSFFLEKSLTFIGSRIELLHHTSIIEKLNMSLQPNDYVILYLDEISLSKLYDPVNKQFFDDKKYRNNQIILILDEVKINQLPEIFHYFQVYPVFNYQQDNILDEEDEWKKNKNDSIKIIELLYDIAHFIKNVKKANYSNDSIVFLGPYDDNTTYEFYKISRELVHRDCNITPAIFNPSAQELLENQEYFKELLASVELSIHFIGFESLKNYPDQTSPTLKINKLVADFCKTPEGENMQRIIFVPPVDDETPDEIKQKVAIFKSDAENIINAELVQTPVERFKDLVIDKLATLSSPIEGKVIEEEVIDDIYLIHPPEYSEIISTITELFEKNNITYSTSQVSLGHLELLHYHQNKLTNCKSVVILNTGNAQWLTRKLSDLKKAPGWGRKKPFKFKMVITDDISEDEKNNIDEQVTWISMPQNGDTSKIESIIKT